MNNPESSRDTLVNVSWEIATYIIYISGIYFIEIILRPSFGSHGMPVIANWIFYLLEITLFFNILHKVYSTIDNFLQSISDSWTVRSIIKRMNSNSEGIHEKQPYEEEILTQESSADEQSQHEGEV